MALFSLIVACTDPAKPDTEDDTGDADTGTYVPVCPEVEPPVLDGQVWAQAGPLPATGMHSVSSDGSAPIWIASHSTGIWRADEDLVWDDVVLGITHTVSEIALRPGDPEHFFRSAGGTAERTRDGGETWTRLPLGELTGGPVDEVRALAVTPWAADRVLGMQRSGAASISEDDGDTWVTAGYAPIHEPPIVDDPFYVWGWRLLPEPEAGGRVVFGDGFGIAVSDDGMATWTRTLDTELGGYSLVRSPTDPTHLFVGSPDGLYESTDEGSTWTLLGIGGDGVGGAWANDGSWVAIVGSTDVLISEDGGATFVARPHTMPMPGGAVILDDGRLVVADHMGAWMSPDRGETWVDISDGLEDRGVSVVATDPHCPARVMAGSRCGGGLFSSEDYGDTWSPVHTYFHYVMGVEFVPDVADAVYAVSDDRLLSSDDAGRTWEEVFQRFHFHGFALHPDEPDTLLLGSVGGGEWADTAMSVYRSTDGGASWADSSVGLPDDASSAHALLRSPDAPDTVLLGTYKAGDVSHRTGQGTGLYRSVDGGLSWAHVDVSVVDVAALAWGGDAVHAATDDGVWRSTDEGVTWTQALGGVGGVIAVRFGDVGTPGALVGLALTAMGDLYKSVDAGETWEQWDTALASNPTTTLAQIAISADGAVGFVTVFDEGVWRIGL